MKVTHQQIADRMGVSRTLVTGVLHGTGRFGANEDTRARILQIAGEMGYSHRNRTTHTIGYLLPQGLTQSSIDLEFVIAAESELRERGYRLTLVNLELPENQSIEDIINPKTVDGVLLTYWQEGKFDSIISPHVPLIVLSEETVNEQMEQVCTDLKGTATVALRHLLDLGHERIVMLSGTTQKTFFSRLNQAAQAAASQLVGELEYAHWKEESFQILEVAPRKSGQRLLELLGTPTSPTAVIVTDAERAISIYCTVLAAGYHIPEDISIVSLFDSRIHEEMVPPLTATDAGGAVLAKLAVDRLAELIQAPDAAPQHFSLAGKLVDRESTRSPRRTP